MIRKMICSRWWVTDQHSPSQRVLLGAPPLTSLHFISRHQRHQRQRDSLSFPACGDNTHLSHEFRRAVANPPASNTSLRYSRRQIALMKVNHPPSRQRPFTSQNTQGIISFREDEKSVAITQHEHKLKAKSVWRLSCKVRSQGLYKHSTIEKRVLLNKQGYATT